MNTPTLVNDGVIADLTADEIVDQLISVAESEDIYEAAISAALPWVEQIDKYKYNIGDLAVSIEKKYGEDRVGSFAKAIKAEVNRVKEYRTVCSRFDKNTRRQIFDENPNLVYSHLRNFGKILGKHEGDYGWKHVNRMIEMTSKYDWTAEKCGVQVSRLLGKKVNPKKWLDCVAKVEPTPVEGEVIITLPKGEWQELTRLLASGKYSDDMRIVVYKPAKLATKESEASNG